MKKGDKIRAKTPGKRGRKPVYGVARSAAERKSAIISRRNDIGPLPAPVDQKRRARCAQSLVAFGVEYCGALLDHPPSARLRAYAETIEAAINGAGQIHVRMARGAGKTTFVKIALAWGLATGRLHYAVVFCASAELAAAIVSDVWDLFEFSEQLAEDWPEVCYPIRKAEGLPQRFAAQNIAGLRTQMRKSAREIRLPTVASADSSGGLLMGRGAGSKTRGLVRGKRRPDLVLLDDLQTREDALNPSRVRKLSAWIDGDVQGLAGQRLLNAVMTSTPIVAGDLSELYADGSAHPEWRRIEYKLIDGEPRAPELWAEYAERWKDARRDGEMTFAAATDFYQAHRAEMDEGMSALDPETYDKRIEISAIQHAQNLRLTMGREAFAAEYQLQVAAAVDAISITPALVCSRLNGAPRGTLPPGTVQAVAFCDVNAVAGISWACVAYGPHGAGAIVDYGRYPGNGARLVPERATETEAQRRIAAALAEVVRRLLDAEIIGPGGTPEKIAAIWIDAGYQQRVVQNVCTVFRARTGRLVWAARGLAHDRYNPAGRHVVQKGDGVDHRALDGQRWFAHDADRWRERAQRAFLGEPMQSGSLSLPGNNPRDHADFAAEVCAEVLAEKISDARGMVHYFWHSRPGAGNHYLDALAGCLAAGAWYRLLDDTAEAIAPIAPARARVAPLKNGTGAEAQQAAPQSRAARSRPHFGAAAML